MPASASPAPVSYATQANTPPNVPVDPTADTLVSSTETLLRNIQGLLKVAADNARQQERQISYEKGRHLHFPDCVILISIGELNYIIPWLTPLPRCSL